jgi:hypothetical protein
MVFYQDTSYRGRILGIDAASKVIIFLANLAPFHQNDNELKVTHSLKSSNPDKAEYSFFCEHING